MEAHTTKEAASKKHGNTFQGLFFSMRRFAQRCRETDAIIRNL